MDILFDQIRSIDNFCDSVRALAKRGELDTALRSVTEFVGKIIERESTWTSVFSSPDLDSLCQELGRRTPHLRTTTPDPESSVFLVTAVAGIGGHTRVLLDLIGADPGKKKTILVTNVWHDLDLAEVKKILDRSGSSAQLEIAKNLSFAERLTWVQQRLASLRPARTYILQHQFDSVITAAVQPELVGQLFYYHNCDHTLTLGVHIPHATHVDFNGKGFHHCKASLGITHNVYWPLVADVEAHRTDTPFMVDGTITTGTSGGLQKFDTTWLREQMPYKYAYADVLPSIMRISGGRHIHIGPLQDAFADKIHTNLAAAGIDRNNFVHIPWVDDVAAALVAQNVDLYVGSFPLGGGRAAIEAMGAGMPLLLHNNYVSPFFTDINEVYPGAFSWRDLDELKTILKNLTREQLAHHSLRARAFYEANHKANFLKAAVEQTLAGCPPEPPPPPAHVANSLQRYLDLRSVPTQTPEAPIGSASSEAPAAWPGVRYLRLTQAVHAARAIRSKHLLVILWRRLVPRKKDRQ